MRRWPQVKRFLVHNQTFSIQEGSDGGSEVILREEDRVISDQVEVCTIFNSVFANVATDIGKDCNIDNLEEHHSIQKKG